MGADLPDLALLDRVGFTESASKASERLGEGLRKGGRARDDLATHRARRPDRRSGTAGARAPPGPPSRSAGSAGRGRRRGRPPFEAGPPPRPLRPPSGPTTTVARGEEPAGRIAESGTRSPSQRQTRRPGERGLASHSSRVIGARDLGDRSRARSAWPPPWRRAASGAGGATSPPRSGRATVRSVTSGTTRRRRARWPSGSMPSRSCRPWNALGERQGRAGDSVARRRGSTMSPSAARGADCGRAARSARDRAHPPPARRRPGRRRSTRAR